MSGPYQAQPAASPRAPASPLGWAMAASGVGLVAAALGYGGCILAGDLPSNAAAWLGFVLAAAVAGGGIGSIWGALHAGGAPVPAAGPDPAADRVPALEQELADRRAHLRQVRHDIRGALSPALLSADRILANPDPAVQRSAEIVVRSVERAITLLADMPAASASPPADR